MKLFPVIKVGLDGKEKALYLGSDRGEARKIYKENVLKKEEYQALFMFDQYGSRTMSKAGFQVHNEAKKPTTKKKSKKKEEK
jgi:uncharacterized protein YneR